MIRRAASRLVRKRLASNPAVALVGPRQCGKTTLARSLGGAYFDLEQESERVRLDVEWESRVSARERLILDEAQAWPPLFPRLRGAIDADRRRNGRFLLLGSVSPALMTRVSESLAGRLAMVELTPLQWGELPGEAERNRLWLCGGFPDGGVLKPRRFPAWQADYLTLLAQRDLPSWGLPSRPQETLRMLRMLAAVHGQAWNASQFGQSLGHSYHTVNSHLDFLAGAFLIRRLAPFHANIGKRVTKSPRVYWRDTGLLHSLLNIADRDSLLAQPWAGASWEGFVIEQVIGAMALTGRPFEPYFFRTSDGHELDLVLETGGEKWAVEIKLSSSPSTSEWERLNKVADMIGATRRFLVSNISTSSGDSRRGAGNLDWMLDVVQDG
ncbi:MAG: ATP-binding protein [Planctomycetes bacterium]|nr:ATP-binding protein [Planctomycetota bacterium]